MGFEVITSPYSPEISERDKKRLLNHYKALKEAIEQRKHDLTVAEDYSDFIKKTMKNSLRIIEAEIEGFELPLRILGITFAEIQEDIHEDR